MWEALDTICSRPWMGAYLRVLAVGYALGALMHYANIAGLGETKWRDAPLAWRLGDIAYAVLDTAAAVMLWLRSPLGVVLFLVAALSQLVLYLGLPRKFAFTKEHMRAIRSMVYIHVMTIAFFVTIMLAGR